MLWLDAFTANVDRTWRNPNLLLWHGDLWVIDHGAALYFHHAWPGGLTDPDAVRRPAAGTSATTCFGAHVDAAPGCRRRTRPDRARISGEVVAEVPDAWLEPVPGAASPDDLRAAYVAFLVGPPRRPGPGCQG